jgi:hypothetical protein
MCSEQLARRRQGDRAIQHDEDNPGHGDIVGWATAALTAVLAGVGTRLGFARTVVTTLGRLPDLAAGPGPRPSWPGSRCTTP